MRTLRKACGESPAYLHELRLQNLDRLNLDELRRQAEIFHTPKLRRAAMAIRDMAQSESQEFETL